MAESLDELRPRAFAIAYRMLGSVGEAEDVVQEGLLRLHAVLAAGEQPAATSSGTGRASRPRAATRTSWHAGS